MKLIRPSVCIIFTRGGKNARETPSDDSAYTQTVFALSLKSETCQTKRSQDRVTRAAVFLTLFVCPLLDPFRPLKGTCRRYTESTGHLDGPVSRDYAISYAGTPVATENKLKIPFLGTAYRQR